MTPSVPQAPQVVREIDPLKVQQFQERLRTEQNLLLGLAAGGLAAVIGAVLWAVVTVITNYQIGWMAIGVAFLVGVAIRVFGKGIDNIYRFMGAGLALFGVVLGNLLMIAALLARQETLPLLTVLNYMLLHPAADVQMLTQSFSPIDLLFYGFAVYYGYKYSSRQVTAAERESLYRQRTVMS
jgi:hypothetical protein